MAGTAHTIRAGRSPASVQETTVKKADLITAIQEQKPRLTKADIQAVVDGITAAAAATIGKGEDFSIPGVARIVIADRAERDGRNPATGAKIKIAARKVLKVKVAGELKNALQD